MITNGSYAKTITAAHRGQQLAQQALSVIEDLRHCLAKSCKDNHIIMPTDYAFDAFSESVAEALAQASPWLRASIEHYGVNLRAIELEKLGQSN